MSLTPNVQTTSFIVLVVLVTGAFVWLILPFAGALLWAVILAILFDPLQRYLEKRMGGRRNIAAAISVLACISIVIIPGSLILASLAQEAAGLYNRIDAREFDLTAVLDRVRAATPPFVIDILSVFNLGSFEEIQARLSSSIGQAAQVTATRALTIGQDTAQLFVSLGVMLYVLFFLFRDGAGLAAMIRKASPLDERYTDHVFRKFADVVRATVQGNVIIAMLQGAAGGLGFWMLGISGALLWGVVMAALSLLPAIGSFLVWGPVAAYLLLSGDWLKGMILLAFGVFVISMIDNLLRPYLVGRGTRLPDYVILVSTLGGIAGLGINGFVVGPLIAALFIAVWSLFADEQERSATEAQPTPGSPNEDGSGS